VRAGRPLYPSIDVATLPSGLLVVLEQDPYAKTVGVVSVVRGGASADPPGAEGLAHLVEHLTFRAVDSSPERPLPLAPAGANHTLHATRRERLIYHSATLVNGLTSPDAITFYEFAPPDRLTWLLDLEAMRLADPLAGVSQAIVALERRTIASEHELRDDPRSGQWASRQFFSELFPSGHPYARAVDGTSKTRSHLTLAEARAFAAENFRPERMTLLVTAPTAGITLKSIVDRLPKSLVGDKNHPVKREAVMESPEVQAVPQTSVRRLPSPLPVPQLWIGWTLPGLWGVHGPSEALLARWVQQDLDLDYLRQEDPNIRHVRALLLPGLKATALMVRVLVDEGADPDRVAQIVAGRVESLWSREPSQHAMLARLKTFFDAELILNEPPQFERAVAQAQLVALAPRPALLADQTAKVHAIEPPDLAKFAYRHLGPKRHRAVLYWPSSVGELVRQDHGAEKAKENHPDALFGDAANWDDMELPDAPSPVSKVAIKKLPSGLTVIVANRRAASATAWLGFRGGYADSDPPLLLELALRMRPDALDVAKVGARSDRGATRDASIDTLEFRPKDLAPALGVLFKKATAQVERWPARNDLARMFAYVNADIDGASEKAAQAFGRALFGENPLARLVTKSDLARITRSDVDSWIGRVHNLHNAALVVVGEIGMDEVVNQATELSRKLGAPAWVDAIPAIPAPVLRPAAREQVVAVVTNRAGALTDVRLGCLLPSMAVGDRPAYEMLRLAMQERLSTALRFERGEGYGVGVSLETVRGGTAFLHVSTFVDAQSLPDTLATLRTYWQRWAGAGFDPGEVNVARWLFTGQFSLAYSTADAVAYRLFNDWNNDAAALISNAGRDVFRKETTSVDAARLNQLFATCRANTVLGVTGHEGMIRQALRKSWPQAN
jgi:zinc protease